MANIIYSFLANAPANKKISSGGVNSPPINLQYSIATSSAALQSTLNTMYRGTTLEGLVEGVGNYGWQKFVAQKSGVITATVRGGSGGISLKNSVTINAVTGAVSGTNARKPRSWSKVSWQF